MLPTDKFEVVFLEDARKFFVSLNEKTRIKILYNIDKAKQLNDPKIFKKVTEHIWEFRTVYGGLQYRLMAFWDSRTKKDTLVIATHGFIKKTDAIPTKELHKAVQLRKIYFAQKGK